MSGTSRANPKGVNIEMLLEVSLAVQLLVDLYLGLLFVRGYDELYVCVVNRIWCWYFAACGCSN